MAEITYADKATGDPYSAADANEVKTVVNYNFNNPPPASLPYTVLIANISQTGTAAPVLTVLQNTTGLTFTPSYSGVGSYLIELSSHPSSAKVFMQISNSNSQQTGITTAIYDNGLGGYIVLSTNLLGTPTNNILYNASIEFRIYP